MKIEIRPITPDDYGSVEQMPLRACDYNEIEASTPDMTVAECVAMCVRLPDTEVILVDGRIIGVLGCAPSPQSPKFGVVWAFGSPEVYDHMGTLTSFARAQICEWLTRYPAGVGNWVDTRNVPSIKWLKDLGFQFHDEEKDLGCGVPFVFFVRYPRV